MAPSAANRAARILGGSRRNRPSRSMTSSGTSGGSGAAARSSFNSGDGSGSGVSGPDGSDRGGGASHPSSSYQDPRPSSSHPPSSAPPGSSLLDDVRHQYESLSERLARENRGESAALSSSLTGSAAGYGSLATGGRSGADSKSKPSRKVRWAAAAAIASTMDGSGDGDDPDRAPRSPLDVLSDLFARKYALPSFLLLAAAIFGVVHLAGGPGDDVRRARYGSSFRGAEGDEGGGGVEGGKGRPVNIMWNRQKVVGVGDGFGDIIFSNAPTPESEASLIPTIEVNVHVTPKVAPLTAGSPSKAEDGNEPGWVVVPTQSGIFGMSGSEAADKGSPTTLKWGYGAGVPTPDPALLLEADLTSPTNMKWNWGEGVPTPDPALLVEISPPHAQDDGSPTTMKWGELVAEQPTEPDDPSPTGLLWNYPPGVPTPDPALLVEISPSDDEGSPTTLKWGGLVAPRPVPVPSPTTPTVAEPVVAEPVVAEPVSEQAQGLVASPDAGSPTTLTWNYPEGSPTPDPALLVGVPGESLVWGYPPGVPTPDPVLLEGGTDTEQMEWGYPDGVPTPDPIYLSGNVEVALASDPVGWGYPDGEPTPDPIYLNGMPPVTEAPTKRNVETGLTLITPKPTPHPTKSPTAHPVTASPIVTLKVMNVAPPRPRPTPKPTPKRAAGGGGGREPQPTPTEPTPAPIPPRYWDPFGNSVEVEPPPTPGRPLRPARPIRPPPAPKVNTKPYEGPGGYVVKNPDETDIGFGGPNGQTIWRPGVEPGNQAEVLYQHEQYEPRPQGQLYYPAVGGMVVPQGQSCGCCCCHCGGGMVGGYAGGMMLPHQAPQAGAVAIYGTAPPTSAPGCPWDCLINETVPTKGISNEDDALYEIFYTNPLNCCGTIVEVGAGDGETSSVSYFFEKGMNWTSILTEADQQSYEKISDVRNSQKSRAINGAFCDKGPFLYYDEASRTFRSPEEEDFTSEEMGTFDVTSATPKVNCINLNNILAGIDHVNVMVVRVKGDPWAAVRTFGWDNTRVEIWVLLVEERQGLSHNAMRDALLMHDYVPAAWDIKLWCEVPERCKQNEVWLRKNFHPLHQPLLGQFGLRGSS